MLTDTSILYIDDDAELSELVQEYMQAKGLKVKLIHNDFDLIPQLKTMSYALCLMDVKMPMKDGFQLAEEIVKEGLDIPFLFLTGQTRKEDRIKGLKLGAEDYISKPFSLEELYLRITNILKRVDAGKARPQSEFALGDLCFLADYCELRNGEKKVHLSSTECKLLNILCQNMNQLVPRKDILIDIWGIDDHYKSLSLNVYITKIRKHLESQSNISLLNEHGEGYKLMMR